MPFYGWEFSKPQPKEDVSPFERLLKIFLELMVYTSGDVAESMRLLRDLDKYYNLYTEDYDESAFFMDLITNGYISKDGDEPNGFVPTYKSEKEIRKKALEDIFKDLKASNPGNHKTRTPGKGEEFTADLKPFEFGDKLEHIDFTTSFKNAQINHGLNSTNMSERDLEVRETFFQSQTSTVLMIDLSHSMILYGEDRITPAKKVALALSELITTRYPKDTLDIIAFGNEAWRVELKDLPYLSVGPFHTNTVAGLELAIQILRKRKNPNRQIFMITDGKPSCIKIGKKFYKNSFGLDKKIVNRTLSLGAQCKKMGIPVTTFMIAQDPYLQKFVDKFTEVNRGKAYFSKPEGLGLFVFKDYGSNKTKRS